MEPLKKWYVAHVILAFEFKQGPQADFSVWENIYLISATSFEEAFAKATKLGQSAEGDDHGTLHWNDRPATLKFHGVRRIMKPDNFGEDPVDGTELTFTEYTVKSRGELQKLVSGGSTRVVYEA